jgi:fructokinase
MDTWIDRLARGLASVINLLDPDVIVVGGGLSRIARLYEGRAAGLGGLGLFRSVATRLVPARHGDASGVRGACYVNLAVMRMPASTVRRVADA